MEEQAKVAKYNSKISYIINVLSENEEDKEENLIAD